MLNDIEGAIISGGSYSFVPLQGKFGIVNALSAAAIERVLASGEHVRSVFCVFTAKADIPSLVDWIFHSVACASVSVLIETLLYSTTLRMFDNTQNPP